MQEESSVVAPLQVESSKTVTSMAVGILKRMKNLRVGIRYDCFRNLLKGTVNTRAPFISVFYFYFPRY